MSQENSTITSSLIQNLTVWSMENNGFLNSNVKIYVDPVMGLSFQANKDISAEITLVQCSSQMTLSYLNTTETGSNYNTHGSVAFCSKSLEVLGNESPHVIGNYLLMQQYLEGQCSFWRHYINLLPHPNEFERLCTPMWWPDTDLKLLEGTNAQPAIETIKERWYDEWQRGKSLVEYFPNSSMFTHDLYKWAATIYATRSFRASLTIPRASLTDENSCSNNKIVILNHIKNDNFSVLLPLLDIGNHNGSEDVQLLLNQQSGCASLKNLHNFKQGTQIYNYYGRKSNTELLVGYGFILPNTYLDTVNLRLSPHDDTLRLRKSQICYSHLEQKIPSNEKIFEVYHVSDDEVNTRSNYSNANFSPGMIDLLSCMVATQREILFLSENPNCCLEHDDSRFKRLLGRNTVQTFQVICDKLMSDVSRLKSVEKRLSHPQNSKQMLAQEYRTRQMDTIQAAHRRLSHHLDLICRRNSLHCITLTQHDESIDSKHHYIELISLEYAYEWLRKYPTIYAKTMKLISEDQAEPQPLDWSILLAEWDRVYWIIWIALISLLQKITAVTFARTHPSLNSWFENMQMSYQHLLTKTLMNGPETDLDSSETETIDEMVASIAIEIEAGAESETLNPITEISVDELNKAKKFAILVANDETVYMACEMQHGSLAGSMIKQKMLCMNIM
ncbi:Ribosomal lysine N-methyltransferase set10 [Golovinomyces cichoracearum]|uniref:Ribosomal lysine N-methyltransferase set10 n=1 Tax=Golovinomyces cichoracearum TaxID=62708 RepID=A0A420IJW2_9PEZI|nr:Ribosomal lysine N-methyltransferase set10 [Golovinomyces cichoracearum]